MRKRSLISTISLVLIGFIFGTFVVTSFSWNRPSGDMVQIGADNPPVERIDVDASKLNNAFVEVAEKVTPSIVQIIVVSTRKRNPMFDEDNPFFRMFRTPDSEPQQRQSGGSGVIISKDGYIITNNHVIENADNVTVHLNDKRTFKATVVGTDPNTDLAVIKIDAKNLPAIYFGNSDKVRIGEWVMAIGNPLSFTSTVTAGIISGRGRNLNIIQSKTNDNYSIEDFLQTDAAINPGNSGGALVDLTGALIGINTAIATNGLTSSYIGYGFAIPINLAQSVARDLIEFGKVNRGYIGIQIQELDAATAKALGLSKPQGVLIQGIVEDGAAANVDVKDGDVILSIDNKELNSPNELQSYIGTKRAGDVVKLKIFRNKKEISRDIKLKARDNDSNKESIDKKIENKSNEKPSKIDKKEYSDVGISVRNLTKAELERLKVKNGILITNVKNYSNAFNQGLRNEFVITEVNQKPINSVGEFDDVITNNKGQAILLKVVFRDVTRIVGLELPE